MGMFDDDFDNILGKSNSFGGFDKIGVSQDTKDTMSSVNKYGDSKPSHGLDIGQQIRANKATNSIDALFVGKPSKNKKSFW